MREDILKILTETILNDEQFQIVGSYIEKLLSIIDEYELNTKAMKASIEPLVRLNDSLQIQNTQYVDKLNELESSNLSRIANAVEIIAKTSIRKNNMIKDHIIT